MFPLERGDLLAKSQDFQCQIGARTKQSAQCSQECEAEVDHETSVVTPYVRGRRAVHKLHISRGDDILATHRSSLYTTTTSNLRSAACCISSSSAERNEAAPEKPVPMYP